MQPILAIRHQVMQLLEEARAAKYVSRYPWESSCRPKTHRFVCACLQTDTECGRGCDDHSDE